MFFLTYFEFSDGQHQHKFWTLGAINDVDEILSHPFFEGLEIAKLMDKQIEAPFVPQLTNPGDVSNFEYA